MFGIFLLFRLFGAIGRANRNKKLSPEQAQAAREHQARLNKEFWKKNPKILTVISIIDIIWMWALAVNLVANHASCHLTGTNC